MRRLNIFLFALMLLPLVFGASTFMDNPDDFFIMSDVVPTPVVTPVGGGGGGYFVSECTNDSDCELGEFCFEGKCYVYECDSDADCNDTKTCWMNRCVKLFDMKIIEVSSPIYPGEFFNFTYYLKGVAAIHGDVIVKFWLVQDEEIVTEGFDTIYMADFDETTEFAELFLPRDILPGTYNFYAEVEYDSYYARAGRIIEVQEAIEEVPETRSLTGQVIGDLGEAITDNIYFVLAVIGILILFVIIYWERREIRDMLASEGRWVNRHKISIGVFLFFIVLIGVLFYSNKAGLIKLSEFHMSSIKVLSLVGLILIGIVILSRVRIKKLLTYFGVFLKSLFVKERGLGTQKNLSKIKLKPQKEIPKIALSEPRAKSIKLNKKVEGKVIHKRTKSIRKKVKKILKRKRRSPLRNVIEKWKRKGYDTESLGEKPKRMGQNKIKTWVEKWRKKGYDAGVINERGYEDMKENG